MAFHKERFKITEWGPKKLRSILKAIETEINERTPQQGLRGIELSQEPDGIVIGISAAAGTKDALAESVSGGGGSSGTASDIYGSLNGQPALFHLLQSANPESPPP